MLIDKITYLYSKLEIWWFLNKHKASRIPSFDDCVNDAFEAFVPYLKWYVNQDTRYDCFNVVKIIGEIIFKAKRIRGKIRQLELSYAGVKNAGIQLWIWQDEKSLVASMAYPVPRLLITVDIYQVEITYFHGRMMNENKWWEQTVISNATNENIQDALFWISTYSSTYQKENK